MKRRGGFSLLETLVSLTLLTVVLLGLVVGAALVAGSPSLDRLQRAQNLARSQVERYRSLSLKDPAWQPSDRYETALDGEFNLTLRVRASVGQRRDLNLGVWDKVSGQLLVSAGLTRAEGGL